MAFLTPEQEKELPHGAVVCDAVGTVYFWNDHNEAGRSFWLRAGAEVHPTIPKRPLTRLDCTHG